MRERGRVQGGRGDGPVQPSVRAGDGFVVVGGRSGLHGEGLCGDGGQAYGGRCGGKHGSPPTVRDRPIRPGEPERFQVLAEESCKSLGYLGLRNRRVVGFPPSDLPDADSESVGQGLLGAVAGCHARGLETDVPYGACHCCASGFVCCRTVLR
ncbi:hypothetical protein GCM10010360_47040 [Streptomyces nogalater]